MLVVQAGEHAHRSTGVGAQDRAQAVEAGGAGQVQVEQHAVVALQLAAAQDTVDGVRDGQLNPGVDLGEQLADEEGVAVVVLDQEDTAALGARQRGNHRDRSSSLPGTQVPRDGGDGSGGRASEATAGEPR